MEPSARRRPWPTIAVVALLLLVATWPVAANGSTVSIAGGTLSYVAAGGETNQLSVSKFVDYDIQDGGAVITAPAACTTVDPPDQHHVTCPATGIGNVNIDLGDLNDQLTVDDSVYPPAVTPGVFFISAEGGPGEDELIGGAGADRLDGGPGDDSSVRGGSGADHVSGGDGDDLVDGEDGPDTVDGDVGADDVVGGLGDDLVRGGSGADEVDLGAVFAGMLADPEVLRGRDVLEGGAGNDQLGVGPGDNLEPDVFSGGDDTDTVSYSGRSAPVTVTLDGVANDGETGEADNVLPDVERVLGGSDSDTLVGSEAADFLDGGPGDDLVSGLGGSDTLQGGVNDSGSDRLVGGAGDDALTGGAGDDELLGGEGADALFGAGGSDALAGEGGQDALEGGTGIDALDGGAGNDTLNGGGVGLIGADGADELNGGTGDDVLLGGPGNDRLDGGLGADRISGEDGRDTVSYEDRGSRVSVTFDGVANDGERDEKDNVLSDVEIVLGGAVADRLVGNDQTNVLDAGSGDDYVDGGRGRDSLDGGTGIDVLRARDGSRDLVSCGEGADLAIVDRRDTVRDCNYVDRGRRRRPPLGRAARVEPMRGTVRLQLPGASRFVPLREAVEVPIGSTLDARKGTVSVVTTKRRGGAVQEGRFRGGPFTVRQRRVARPVTQLRLTRVRSATCRGSTRGRANARVRLVARIAKKRRGSTQVRGRYSVGGSYGTTWLTEDRCDGTLTRVMSGTVRVQDLRRHRTVVVRAGRSYLARARSGTSRATRTR
jgi:Ca2+-binding RTX toxin-like protein